MGNNQWKCTYSRSHVIVSCSVHVLYCIVDYRINPMAIFCWRSTALCARLHYMRKNVQPVASCQQAWTILCCQLWTMLCLQTSLFYQYCFLLFQQPWTTVVASSMLNNIVETILVNNIVHWTTLFSHDIDDNCVVTALFNQRCCNNLCLIFSYCMY